jgi:hypothetical protein
MKRVIEASVATLPEYLKLEGGLVIEKRSGWLNWHRATPTPRPILWLALDKPRWVAFPIPDAGIAFENTWASDAHNEGGWLVVPEHALPVIAEVVTKALDEVQKQ